MTRKAPDPVRQHGGAGAPWFEAASPGLLTNRTARNFLMSYTEAQYAEVVKLLTIQGICSLAQTHGPRVLPLAELREAVAHAQAALTLEEHIPEVAGKLATVQAELEAMQADLLEPRGPAAEARAKEATAAACDPAGPRRVAGAARPRTGPERPRAAAGRLDTGRFKAVGGMKQKPSARWRAGEPSTQGDKVHIRKEPEDPVRLGGAAAGMGPEVYPSWWFHQNVAAPAPAPEKKRAGPRLAYSKVRKETRRVVADDLVTAKYLNVPSSGYGRKVPRARAPGAMAHAVAEREYEKKVEQAPTVPVVAVGPERPAPAGTAPGAAADDEPASTVVDVADKFLADPWMTSFAGPAGESLPALHRAGIHADAADDTSLNETEGSAAGVTFSIHAPPPEVVKQVTKRTDEAPLSLHEKRKLYGNWIGDFSAAPTSSWKPLWADNCRDPHAMVKPVPSENDPAYDPVRAAKKWDFESILAQGDPGGE